PMPPPPSERGSTLPALDPLILKCLALDPGARYPSAVELLEALERIEGGCTACPTPNLARIATIGRSIELAEAERFLDSCARGAEGPRTLLLTGPAGMGQTHFLRELKVRGQMRGLKFYLEAGYPGRSSAPGTVLSCLGAHLSAKVRSARERWERFLDHLRRPRNPSRSEASESERRLRRANEALLAAEPASEPFVLAVDGLQAWDEVSISLVFDLSRFLSEMPLATRPQISFILGYR